MDNPKNQIAQKLKDANNVLVTVSANPTIDQLAAAIGLTLLLNKLEKHASAVFSGQVPSTIEFLKPEDTIEKNTDSLRDFIIALDKSKADKLRYKVEDKMVKIFITPYRTSITDQDLIFSQGDFNVDVVVGLGVKVREDLDQAIVTHGGILHDATVISINTAEVGSIGSVNWVDAQASSLCEMIVAEAELIKSGLIDGQIATALLTGIVAETERFSNAKTTSNTMSASAKLMAAGANQQLVATQLETPETTQPLPEQPRLKMTEPTSPEEPVQPEDTVSIGEDGTLQVEHQDELPEPQPESADTELPNDSGDEDEAEPPVTESNADERRFMVEPPAPAGPVPTESDNTVDPVAETENEYGTPLTPHEETAEDEKEEKDEPVSTEDDKQHDEVQVDELSADMTSNDAEKDASTAIENVPEVEAASVEPPDPAPVEATATTDGLEYIETPTSPTAETLDSIERKVGSPHVNAVTAPTSEPAEPIEKPVDQQPEPVEAAAIEASDIDQARTAVQAAMDQAADNLVPDTSSDDSVQDLPDIHIDPDTGNISPPPTVISPTVPGSQTSTTNGQANSLGMPPTIPLDTNPPSPGAPPEVPPPMMPPMNGAATSFSSTPNPFSTLPPSQ